MCKDICSISIFARRKSLNRKHSYGNLKMNSPFLIRFPIFLNYNMANYIWLNYIAYIWRNAVHTVLVYTVRQTIVEKFIKIESKNVIDHMISNHIILTI